MRRSHYFDRSFMFWGGTLTAAGMFAFVALDDPRRTFWWLLGVAVFDMLVLVPWRTRRGRRPW